MHYYTEVVQHWPQSQVCIQLVNLWSNMQPNWLTLRHDISKKLICWTPGPHISNRPIWVRNSLKTWNRLKLLANAFRYDNWSYLHLTVLTFEHIYNPFFSKFKLFSAVIKHYAAFFAAALVNLEQWAAKCGLSPHLPSKTLPLRKN